MKAICSGVLSRLAVVAEPSRRAMALADPDFDLLAAEAEFGPQYRRVVGDGTGSPRRRGGRANRA
ncbi:MAG: hypothetical protein ABSA21_10285 [Candidatus Limnocylindrales bacterium]